MPSANNHHAERMIKTIAHEAANFVQREASTESLITVVRAESMSGGERIVVFVSVFPDNMARSALLFLEHKREAFSDYLKETTRLQHLPRIDFLLDNRERDSV